MARGTDKRAHREPWPFGALAGKYPSIEIEDIKAARREALIGIDQPTPVGTKWATAPTEPQRSPTDSPPREPALEPPHALGGLAGMDFARTADASGGALVVTCTNGFIS